MFNYQLHRKIPFIIKHVLIAQETRLHSFFLNALLDSCREREKGGEKLEESTAGLLFRSIRERTDVATTFLAE